MSKPSGDEDVRERPRVEDDELSLLDYVAAVWRRRWLVGAVCVVTVVATFVVTIQTDKIYESTATMLSPKEAVGGLGLLSGLAGMAGMQLPGAGGSAAPNRDMFVGIIKSRTVAEGAVDRFKLQERYQVRYRGRAIRRLQEMADAGLAVSKEGVISIRFEDTDPKLAAALTDFYVAEVDRLVTMYNTSQAGRQFGFLASQVAAARNNLERAEEAFRSFQERNRAIGLPEQTRVAIEGAAQLKGQITALEVQLQAMRAFATDRDAAVISVRRRIEEMERQLSKLQYGDGAVGQPGGGQDRQDFVVPFAKVPQVGLELARVTRELKIQQAIVEVLTQQLEQSRLSQAQDLPVVQVLDRPVPAEWPSRPRLLINLAVAGVGSLFLGVLLASFLDYVNRARQAWPRPS